MRKRAVAVVASVAGFGGWLASRSRPAYQKARPQVQRAVNRTKGLAYRVARRHPTSGVDDSVLADRIRSTIGPLEKQLHSSRINVTVENGIAILHGELDSSEAAAQIEDAVRGVAGVRDIRSHLTP